MAFAKAVPFSRHEEMDFSAYVGRMARRNEGRHLGVRMGELWSCRLGGGDEPRKCSMTVFCVCTAQYRKAASKFVLVDFKLANDMWFIFFFLSRFSILRIVTE